MFAGSRQPSFGFHNPSPIKKRNKKKTNTYVTPPLQGERQTALFNRLQELRSRNNEPKNMDDIIENEIEDLEEIDPSHEAVDTAMFDASTEYGKSVIFICLIKMPILESLRSRRPSNTANRRFKTRCHVSKMA
jgi:hypothetical protein